MIHHLLNGLSALGNILDLPGSSVRDLLAGNNPLDQWATPLHDENRITGRDLLRHHGLASHDNTWGNFIGGLGAEILTDPTNLIPGRSLLNATRARNLVREVNGLHHAANIKSAAQRASGYMPHEIASQTVLRNADGTPRTYYHGTNAAFDKFDMAKDQGNNLYGPGVYHTADRDIASEYTDKGARYSLDSNALGKVTDLMNQEPDRYLKRALKDQLYPITAGHKPDDIRLSLKTAGVPSHVLDEIVHPAPLNVRMAHVDIRNPFKMDEMHPVSSIKEVGYEFPLNNALAGPRAELRESIGDLRNLRKSSDSMDAIDAGMLAHDVKHRFKHRHSLTGDQIADVIPRARLPRVLRQSGFDGIIHEGGSVLGGAPHDVAIAFDPSQVYKPYVAPEMKPMMRLPSRRPAAIGLAGQSVLPRMGGYDE